MFGDQFQERGIPVQLINNIICQKHDLVFKQPDLCSLQIPVSLFKNQSGPVCDQLIPDIGLILKIKSPWRPLPDSRYPRSMSSDNHFV